jgi:ABC-type methionine transport system ATPase subunit
VPALDVGVSQTVAIRLERGLALKKALLLSDEGTANAA